MTRIVEAYEKFEEFVSRQGGSVVGLRVSDKSKVIIKCVGYEGKEIVLPTRTIKLDEKGCCEVTGEEAKRLLSIPGYELAK